MARASIYIMNLDKQTYEKQTSLMSSYINIGSGVDLTIAELAEVIKKVVKFKGEIYFDTTKPDGVSRKLLNSERLNNLGFRHKTNLKEGLIQTYRDYIKSKC